MAYQKSIKQQSRLKNRINFQILAHELRVIDQDGKQIGILATKDALLMAQELGLDLIEINESSKPPIARIGDWGKFRYEQEKKLKKSLSANKSGEVKQIKMNLRIGEGDLARKLDKVVEMLKDGDRVRVSVMLKGRENAHIDLAYLLLDKICGKIEDSAAVEQKPTQNGRTFSVVFKSK